MEHKIFFLFILLHLSSYSCRSSLSLISVPSTDRPWMICVRLWWKQEHSVSKSILSSTFVKMSNRDCAMFALPPSLTRHGRSLARCVFYQGMLSFFFFFCLWRNLKITVKLFMPSGCWGFSRWLIDDVSVRLGNQRPSWGRSVSFQMG